MTRANDRTRTFNGTYTSRDGKKHKLNVRVYNRLGAFGLSLVLAAYAAAYTHTVDNSNPENANRTAIAVETNSDIEKIESIIRDNPNILKDVTNGTYTIKYGDTLSHIALECGTTLKRICALNNIDSKDIIYPGEEIKTEVIKDKADIDKDIASLESYFSDYLFNSPIAELAKSGDESDYQASFYRSIIYGSPKSEVDVDPNSLYGSFVISYLKFHEKEEITLEDKQVYRDMLEGMVSEYTDQLTLGGSIDNLVPYEKYRLYLENGTTKYDEPIDQMTNIYS